jgi:hypothetical protein
MAKEVPAHKDKLGRLIKIGDCVAYPDSNSLVVGVVKKLNPKMIGVSRIKAKWTQNKYPQDMVLLEGPEVTMYMLKESAK